ncbi:MAG: hypothetical protein RQ754_08860 [Desulfuromonadales bacterium]|nr:hypothetical protein [Desulfuromonadales bacterium]
MVRVPFVVLCCWFLIFLFSSSQAQAGGLEIRNNTAGSPYLSLNDKPVLAYGPSPQKILTYLPHGNGNDINDWVRWASRFGINHVRSYPPSTRVSGSAKDVFLKSRNSDDRFDLTLFNQEYFEELRRACVLLKEKGFIVHLQLWQAVTWKKDWKNNYYNPKNNINPSIAKYAGPGEFVTIKNPVLLAHQKEFVRKILDATADLGNVFYDVMNEIGNGTGISEEWVLEIVSAVNKWEMKNGIDVLLTLNDEGGKRMGNFSLESNALDLIVMDLGRYDQHLEAKRWYGKPSLSVRNIDYNYETKERLYFYGRNNLEINDNENLQVRGRKYWWRMFMAGVQSAGGYADAVEVEFTAWKRAVNKLSEIFTSSKIFSSKKISTYRLNKISEIYFTYFKNFIDKISHYEDLVPDTRVELIHPSKHKYCLQSDKQAIIYLESPNGASGIQYGNYRSSIKGLFLDDGYYDAFFYHPSDGVFQLFQVEIDNGKSIVDVPEFVDDLVIYINFDKEKFKINK